MQPVVDADLCLENANQRGYVWIKDIPLNRIKPIITDELVPLLQYEGYRLGRSVTFEVGQYAGLYAPGLRRKLTT